MSFGTGVPYEAYEPVSSCRNRPGRPREFDPDAALGAALDLFWRQGYEATSLEDLTQAMGVSRSSFYSFFGSKRQALIAAITRYADTRFGVLSDLASDAGDPRDAVRNIAATIADPEGGNTGCFLVNCLTELAPHDAEVAAIVCRQIERIERLITEALARAGGPEDQVEDRARAILSLALGATAMRKSGMPGARIASMLPQIEALLP